MWVALLVAWAGVFEAWGWTDLGAEPAGWCVDEAAPEPLLELLRWWVEAV